MKVVTLFACESCGTEYRTGIEAEACESRAAAMRPSVKVGDIVMAKGGFGWYDGDRKWISNADAVDPLKRGNPGPIQRHKCPNHDSNCFSECCTFSFYYVVAHIDIDDFNRESRAMHRARYHLVTNAMTGKNGYHAGFTYDSGHYTPKVVVKPPSYVRRSSRALIGEKADHLL